MLLAKAIADATENLLAAGVLSPAVDAEEIACHVLGVTRSDLVKLKLEDFELSQAKAEDFSNFVKRRASREPLQHLTGVANFRKLNLEVGPGVFIPRPETELLVDFALELLGDTEQPKIVDLCSGSGAIAIALATEKLESEVFAVEASKEAAVYLKANFAKYGLAAGNIRIGDLGLELSDFEESFDLVASNPPYIPADAVPIYEEVRLYDPALALYGGEDGLDVIRKISVKALELLKPGGHLVMEHGENQAGVIGELLLADGWVNVTTRKDFTGKDRLTAATKP